MKILDVWIVFVSLVAVSDTKRGNEAFKVTLRRSSQLRAVGEAVAKLLHWTYKRNEYSRERLYQWFSLRLQGPPRTGNLQGQRRLKSEDFEFNWQRGQGFESRLVRTNVFISLFSDTRDEKMDGREERQRNVKEFIRRHKKILNEESPIYLFG